jgi:hypothetical protein
VWGCIGFFQVPGAMCCALLCCAVLPVGGGSNSSGSSSSWWLCVQPAVGEEAPPSSGAKHAKTWCCTAADLLLQTRNQHVCDMCSSSLWRDVPWEVGAAPPVTKQGCSPLRAGCCQWVCSGCALGCCEELLALCAAAPGGGGATRQVWPWRGGFQGSLTTNSLFWAACRRRCCSGVALQGCAPTPLQACGMACVAGRGFTWTGTGAAGCDKRVKSRGFTALYALMNCHQYCACVWLCLLCVICVPDEVGDGPAGVVSPHVCRPGCRRMYVQPQSFHASAAVGNAAL